MTEHSHQYNGDTCTVCRYQRVAGETVVSFGKGRSAAENNKLADAILGDPKGAERVRPA